MKAPTALSFFFFFYIRKTTLVCVLYARETSQPRHGGIFGGGGWAHMVFQESKRARRFINVLIILGITAAVRGGSMCAFACAVRERSLFMCSYLKKP